MAGVATHTLAERIGSRLNYDAMSGCWNWTGSDNGKGYGRIYSKGRFVYVHRASYEIARGPIPEGLQLDHLCRNPRCANPAHLEAVTNAENTRRGKVSALRDRPAPTHCKRGHAYAERGTRDTKGNLRCRECARVKRFDQMRAEGRPQRVAYPKKGSDI